MIPKNNSKFFKFDNIVQMFDCIARILVSNELINKKATIVCKKVSSYDKIISNIFQKYEISFNKNYYTNIYDNKIYLLIVSLINFIRYGLKQEYIIDFLNLYPLGFDNEKIWEFKEYCSTYDISNFDSEFILSPIRKLKNKEINLKILESLNETRLQIVELFLNLKKELKKNGICKSILNFINEKEYFSNEHYDIFYEFLHRSQNVDLSIEDFDKELGKFINNISGKLSKEVNIDIIEDLGFQDLSSRTIFIIIEGKDKFSDYEDILPNFENKYLIFLNDEYLKIKDCNLLSADNVPNCSLKYKSPLENFSCTSELSKVQIDEVSIATSKIENYYRCSLFYFFSCIIDIYNSRKFTFDSSEYGSLVHHTFEQYLKSYSNFDIEETIYKIVKEYMDSMFRFIYSPSKLKYMSKKYSKNLTFIISKMNKELEKDRFFPEHFEVKIFQEMKTYSGKSFTLKGKIDRVDIDPERKEMRTIDYKTQNKKFSISNIVHGLNIQPIVYLRFFPEKSLKKTGAFYFCTKKPTINGDDVDLNTMNLDKKINEFISLQGISLENRNFMESRGTRNDFLSYEEFKTIMDYSEFLIKQMAENIMNGNMYKNPSFFLGAISQCENCAYKDICERKNMRYIKNTRYRNNADAIRDMQRKMDFI